MSFLNIGKKDNKNITKSKIVEVSFIKNIDEIDVTNVNGEVQEETRKILVQKAPLGKYEQLSIILEKFFDLFIEFLKDQGVKDPTRYIEQLDVEDLIALLPKFISGLYKFAIDEMIEFISIGTGIDEEFIRENIDAGEAYEIVKAIIEVNGLLKVVSEVKNLMNLPDPVKKWIGKNFSGK